MKNLNEVIKVVANQRMKTFTIRKYVNNVLSAKYRTNKMSENEFFDNEMNSNADWKQFLKNGDYYKC